MIDALKLVLAVFVMWVIIKFIMNLLAEFGPKPVENFKEILDKAKKRHK